MTVSDSRTTHDACGFECSAAAELLAARRDMTHNADSHLAHNFPGSFRDMIDHFVAHIATK